MNRAQYDPLVKAVKKARKESVWGQLEVLLRKRSKYQARITRAEKEVHYLDEDIKNFARQLASEADLAGVKGDVLQRCYDQMKAKIRKEGV